MIDREKVIKKAEHIMRSTVDRDMIDSFCEDVIAVLKEQEAAVHPEPSCKMTYITDCCCDLCGVQLIREDNFCRCCGKPILWEGR